MRGPITFGGGRALSGAGIGSESVNESILRPLANLYSESSARTAAWLVAPIGRGDASVPSRVNNRRYAERWCPDGIVEISLRNSKQLEAMETKMCNRGELRRSRRLLARLPDMLRPKQLDRVFGPA